MASLNATRQLPLRLSARAFRRRAQARGLAASCRRCAAQNYNMPALSPTMTEGNITKWNLKEGDAFSAGDVLLEVETDKAQMDVEAQDDGVLAKIMQGDGAKGVKVGARIAVLAEEGDDIASLEIPAEDTSQQSSGSTQQKPKEGEHKSEASSASSVPEGSAGSTSADPQKQESKSHAPSLAKAQVQKYPLYPAVEHLLHTNGMSEEDASKIPASGPNGRLLKGDVLSYLGLIEKDYAASQSERIEKLGHLDLSNIQKAEPKPTKEPTKDTAEKSNAEAAKAKELPAEPQETSVAIPISLAAVYKVQRRIQEALGLTLPLATFVARASEIANQDLPVARRAPTEDELFDSILGLDKVAQGVAKAKTKTSKGHFMPLVTAIPPPGTSQALRSRKQLQPDVMDILTGSRPAVPAPQASGMPRMSTALQAAGAENMFSVSAKKGEERRARVYLERMKSVLEAEPGRCVL